MQFVSVAFCCSNLIITVCTVVSELLLKLTLSNPVVPKLDQSVSHLAVVIEALLFFSRVSCLLFLSWLVEVWFHQVLHPLCHAFVMISHVMAC